MTAKGLIADKRLYSLLAILWLSVVIFPGSYLPTGIGLDISWRYALNYLPHSDQIFGRDVVFTYGPLGFLMTPLNIESNLLVATLLHVVMHALLLVILLNNAFRNKRPLQTIFFAVGYALAPLVGEGLTDQYEYAYLTISCMLLASSYEGDTFSPVADLINPLLAALFLFMKFSMGMSATVMIAAMSIVRITRRQENAWRSGLIGFGVWLVTMVIIIATIFRSFGNFVAWLVASWHVADGYSVAMSMLGKPHVLTWALLGVAVYIMLLAVLRVFNSHLFGLGLVFAISIFFCFKHSYIRQDGHVLYFFPFLVSLIGVLVLHARDRREFGLATVAFVSVFFMAMPIASKYNYLERPTVVEKISGQKGLQNLSSLVHFRETRDRLDAQGQFNLLGNHLPAEWLGVIREDGGRVGTLPWEVSYCMANNLVCDSFPAMQTYNAYKAPLDEWCASHYTGKGAPDFLLINFEDIDERNLVLSTPATWRMILKNYGLVETDPEKRIHLFRKRNEPVVPNLAVTDHNRGRLSDWISVPESEKPLYGFIDMRLRPLGLASKTFYHVPPVYISLQFESGKFSNYRMIPDTAQNGLLLNYLPTNMKELIDLFAQTATDRVVKFRIAGPGAKFYKNDFELTWKEDPSASISLLPFDKINIESLRPRSQPALFAIDALNNRPAAPPALLYVDSNTEDAITIAGWAVDPESKKEAGGVFVSIDGKDIPAEYHGERKDVAVVHGNPNYASSGFFASFPTSVIGKGKHVLSLKVVTNGRDGYFQPEQPITFEVR